MPDIRSTSLPSNCKLRTVWEEKIDFMLNNHDSRISSRKTVIGRISGPPPKDNISLPIVTHMCVQYRELEDIENQFKI